MGEFFRMYNMVMDIFTDRSLKKTKTIASNIDRQRSIGERMNSATSFTRTETSSMFSSSNRITIIPNSMI